MVEAQKRIVVVLGAGRCGTSLLMQMLSRLGMSISEKLVPAKTHNTLGPMEDQEIAEIYDKEILTAIGSSRVLPFASENFTTGIQNKIRQRLIAVLEKNLNVSDSIWGFKDPFTSLILPFWYRIFNQTNIIPIFILAVRNPSQSVISRKKHFGVEESLGELAWLTNYVDAMHHISADCFIVHYEEWFTRPKEMAQGLLSYTGLDHYFKGDLDEAIQSVIKPNLNRAVHEDYQVQNQYVLKLYEALKACRGSEFDRQRLMGVVKECRKAMDEFKGWYLEAQKYLKKEKEASLNHKNKNSDAETDLQKLVKDNNRLLIENKDYFEELEECRKQIFFLNQNATQPENRSAENSFKGSSTQNQQIEKWKNEVLALRRSYSFRLGQILINALTKPGKNTVLMPYNLIKLGMEMVSGRGRQIRK